MGVHFDETVTGELVRLLAMFAAPLPVALAGEATVTAVRLAHLAEGEHEVDPGVNAVHALAVLLGAAAAEDHRTAGCCQPSRRGAKLGFAHAGEPLHERGMIF